VSSRQEFTDIPGPCNKKDDLTGLLAGNNGVSEKNGSISDYIIDCYKFSPVVGKTWVGPMGDRCWPVFT
jgi:hypothetical protein